MKPRHRDDGSFEWLSLLFATGLALIVLAMVLDRVSR